MECILRHPVKIDAGKYNSGRVVRTAHDGKLAIRIGHGKVKSMQGISRVGAWATALAVELLDIPEEPAQY